MPDSDLCGSTHNWSALSLFTGASCILLIVLTIPLNIAVIVAIIKSKSYTSSFYIIMLNIAISDLLVGIFTEPIGAVFIIKEGYSNSKPTYGEVKLFMLSLFPLGASSVLSMALLNFDRYISMQRPGLYNSLSRRYFFAALFMIWVISSVCGYLSLRIGFSRYLLIFSLCIILLTVAIMGITIRTFWKKLVTVAATEDNRLSISPGDQNSKVATTKVFSIGRFRATRNERRIIRTLFFMIMIFICCYFPIFLACIYLNLCKDCNCLLVHILRDIVILAILVSSVARPINFLKRLTNLRDELHCFSY